MGFNVFKISFNLGRKPELSMRCRRNQNDTL